MTIYAKLEGQNPTGSIKDRVAKAMIEAAEASGELEPGRALLEPTSGNTGISLALVASLKGYPLTCVLPENATDERKRLLRLYGAEIVLSPAAEGSNGAVRLALEMAESDPRWFVPFQYANEANPRAHYEGTGAEIAAALDRVDVLVAGLGTGGTLMGAGERLRESFPDIVVAAAEPLPGDPVMGLRSLDDGYVPPILDVSRLDRKVLVSNEESVAADARAAAARGDLRRRLRRRRGPCRAATRRRARRGCRRRDPRRRRLEVPERRLLGRARGTAWRSRWSRPSGGDPGRGAGGDRRARAAPSSRTRPAGSCSSTATRRSSTCPARTRRRRRTSSSCASTRSAWADIGDRDLEQAVVHSHVSSPPRPSRTDVERIGLWRGRPYVIYSVRLDELAAWRIGDGQIESIALRGRRARPEPDAPPTRRLRRP